MTASTQSAENTSASTVQPSARFGLALVRLTIGAMFIWVFFENLGKDLYKPANYAGLINDYIQNGSAPAVWKHVMQLMASHASMAAPLQGATEISVGALLLLGLLTRPVAVVAFGFLGSLWISEWGTAWIWELLVPVLASLSLVIGRAGRTWGIDSVLGASGLILSFGSHWGLRAGIRHHWKPRQLAGCLRISPQISCT